MKLTGRSVVIVVLSNRLLSGLAFSCLLLVQVHAFVTPPCMMINKQVVQSRYIGPSLLRSNIPLAQDEQEENEDDERKRLMEQVRSVQDLFYSSPSEQDATKVHSDTIVNLPIYRKVGQAELPGRGTLAYVADSRYTHMFETIVRGPEPWYVGQVYLAEGKFDDVGRLCSWREKKDNGGGECAIGTLLRIKDYRRVNDGRMVLWVHGLERFVVTKVMHEKQQFYPVADVRCLPDTEDMNLGLRSGGSRSQSRRRAMDEALMESESNFELPGEGEIAVQDLIGADLENFMPLGTFEPVDRLVSFVNEEKQEGRADSISLECQLEDYGIMSEFPSYSKACETNQPTSATLERKLWLQINEYVTLRDLEYDALPRELLKLIPPDIDWPVEFGLCQFALENRFLKSHDDSSPDHALSADDWSHRDHRRQRQLSYAATVLLGGTARSQGLLNRGMRQRLLEVPSTIGRLWAVLECFDEFLDEAGLISN